MKANKITLKKIRLEYLERIANDLQDTLDYRRNRLSEAEEELADFVSTPVEEGKEHGRDASISYRKDSIEKMELEIKEGEKLLAELEKMV